MLSKEKAGFTLFELMVVIIIVAILAALGLPQYTKTKEHALGREAIANLKLIAAAQRLYAMEYNTYYPVSPIPSTVSDIAAINSNLRVSIPTTGSRSWNYSITDTTGTAFTATATRISGTICSYYIDNTIDDPTTVACP